MKVISFLSFVLLIAACAKNVDAPPDVVSVTLTPNVTKGTKPGSNQGIYISFCKQSTGFKGNGYVVIQWDDMLAGVKQATLKDTVSIPDPGNVEVFHYTNYPVGSGNAAANVKIISHQFDNPKVSFTY